MNILAIDTSTKSISVSLFSDDQLKGEVNLRVGLVHSKVLMPVIENLFELAQFNKKDLDLLFVTKGPGSFTGIRIGVATVNAIAMALNIPIMESTSLDLFKENFSNFKGLIITTIDARRDIYYSGFYESDGFNVKKIKESEVIESYDLFDFVKRYLNKDKENLKLNDFKENILIAGDSIDFIKECIDNEDNQDIFKKVYFPKSEDNFIKTSNIFKLEDVKIKFNEINNSNLQKNLNYAKPLYMQKSQAEIERDKKAKK